MLNGLHVVHTVIGTSSLKKDCDGEREGKLLNVMNAKCFDSGILHFT